MEIKPMIYEDESKLVHTPLCVRKHMNLSVELLYSNTYKGYIYHIVNMWHDHLRVYIETEDLKLMQWIDDNYSKLGLHYGLDFKGYEPLIHKWCFGWFHNHEGDYTSTYKGNRTVVMWTSEEVDDECKIVIDNIVKYKDVRVMK